MDDKDAQIAELRAQVADAHSFLAALAMQAGGKLVLEDRWRMAVSATPVLWVTKRPEDRALVLKVE